MRCCSSQEDPDYSILESSAAHPGHSRAEGTPQSWHVAWAGAASRGQHLEVPGALAGCLNIAQGITVTARAVPDIPEAIGVCVEPISVDDWEVVEQNAGHMEDQILSQVANCFTCLCLIASSPPHHPPPLNQLAMLVSMSQNMRCLVAPDLQHCDTVDITHNHKCTVCHHVIVLECR